MNISLFLNPFLMIASILCLQHTLWGQSIELMPGTERVFTDIQWIKPLKKNQFDWTMFNRTRITVDYENQSDLFSAFYLSYTTKKKIGPSLLGSVSTSAGATAGFGIHLFHSTDTWTIFTLIATEIKKNPSQSFFLITRYRPPINERLKLYTALELLSLMNGGAHAVSIQRLRLGLDTSPWQFGLGLNMSQFGTVFSIFTNPGLFVRREF